MISREKLSCFDDLEFPDIRKPATSLSMG